MIGPPPPASGGVHIAQMLNILEGFDVAAMGFGSPDSIHLLAEALKIAFADRAVATADPAFVEVPVERLISKAYAAERRAEIDLQRARTMVGRAASTASKSSDTTHVTVADADGFVVSATHTINGLFGACVQIPGTGMIANNYMHNFDPHPGRALSIAPGKRVFSSMAPMMVTEDGAVRLALGLPGALRIFPSAFQAIVNWIDHGMDVQEAVEAPRIWTEGGALELEPAYSDATAEALAQRGHTHPAHEAHRRRHERHRVRSRRHDDRRRLLARRRHAGRHRRRACPPRRQLRDDLDLMNGETRRMTHTVVLLDLTSPERAEHLRRLLPPDFVLTHGTARGDEHLKEIIRDADFAISGQVGVSGDVLRAARRLKLLHKWGVGVDNIDTKDRARARHQGGAHHRQQCRAGRRVHDRADPRDAALPGARPRAAAAGPLDGLQPDAGRDVLLSGKTVGLVGFGAIGQAVASRLRGLRLHAPLQQAHRDSRRPRKPRWA